MGAKSKKEITKLIYDSLDEIPRSIKAIAENSKTTWEATKNVLELLSYINIIKKNYKNKEPKYYKININNQFLYNLDGLIKSKYFRVETDSKKVLNNIIKIMD